MNSKALLRVFAWAGFTVSAVFLAPQHRAWAQAPSSATSAAQDDSQEFRDIAKDLRCPTCQGLSVLDSDAAFSVQIKDQVKTQMGQGKSKAEIMQFFTERYGPWILRSPPNTGFNAIAWALPMALLCLGPPAVWLLVWRRRRTVSTFGVKSADAILAEMQERLSAARTLRSRGSSET